MNRRVTCPSCRHSFDPPASEPPADEKGAALSLDAPPASSAGPRRTTRGTVYRTIGFLVILLCASALLITAWVVRGELFAQRPQTAEGRSSQSGHEPPPGTPKRPDPPPLDPSQASPVAGRPESEAANMPPSALAEIAFGVVKIVAHDLGGDRGLGSGVIVDQQGLIATSLHVVSAATEAQAEFEDGSRYRISGYAAVAPENDLALLVLENRPLRAHAIPLASADVDLPALTPVVAIGHPEGAEFSPFDGKVSRVLLTDELRDDSRQFVRRLTHDSRLPTRWIQHTARLSPGNSGGPLLRADGTVIGINSWVDQGTGFGYAVHVEQLRRLLEQPRREIEPLAKRAETTPRIQAMLDKLDADVVRKLHAGARQTGWRPRSQADYDALAELAWAITFAASPGGFGATRSIEPAEREALIRAGDLVVRDLKEIRWDAGQLTTINEHAAQNVGRPWAGLFLFATVERQVTGPQGARGLLMQLAGAEQKLFFRTDDQLLDLKPGTQCVVLGVNYGGHTVRYGDNPLNPTVADVIYSRTILRWDL